MNRLGEVLRAYVSEPRSTYDDNCRAMSASLLETARNNEKQYVLYEPTPLTEEEVRQLPVAHQYSA